ncbi:MAG: DNA-formamidopyrimidine glycosylase [Bacilli bacterium]|nr:DNA-formamidopyrimidine glycosylase [Bacilli bacterium]
MPELPEVETVRQDLKKNIVGKAIKKVDVYYDKIIKQPSPADFVDWLEGQSFVDFKRKGKYLIMLLTDMTLISHLRMEGKYFIKKAEPPVKHEHLIFHFTDGTSLRYHDVRKFGTMNLFKTKDLSVIYQQKPLNNVGFDPFEEELNSEDLYNIFQKISKPIKATLLDQQIISGLGNIYVDEVCFLSGLHPSTSTKLLSLEQVKLVLDNSKIVLNKAISLGGTTIKSFSSHEISGRFQNELLVHTKEYCPTCKEKIIKIRVSGRGTYFCQFCQKGIEAEGKD